MRQRQKPLVLGLLLALTACGGSTSVGELRLTPLSPEVRKPCPDPWEIDHANNWEIFAGRLGDALIECGDEKGVAVRAVDGRDQALTNLGGAR